MQIENQITVDNPYNENREEINTIKVDEYIEYEQDEEFNEKD